MKLRPRTFFCLILLATAAGSAEPQRDQAMIAGLPPVSMYAGEGGEPYSWEALFAAMDAADVVVIGESHTDARGHAIQADLIRVAVRRWPGITVSVEEFDRSQQADVDAFARGELTGEQLKQVRAFVGPRVKDNWEVWYLPKLKVARDADAPLLASNAPLKYSRIVRNYGCDNLPELSAAELELFECPVVPIDPDYRARFIKKFQRTAVGHSASGLKALKEEQMDKLFRAQRVWDATMADSIAQARAAGAAKVLHLVGGFHSSYNGGLMQELRARDAEASILVISLVARRGQRLAAKDEGRADVVIYTRN